MNERISSMTLTLAWPPLSIEMSFGKGQKSVRREIHILLGDSTSRQY